MGGLPAVNVDFEDALAGRTREVVGLVVGGTLLALLVGFRSVLVAVKATVLNLLSVSAAFGAVVLVFQEGRGAAWVGLSGPTGGLFPAVPLFVFAVVFGLSMDYEVFLVSRVAEARRAGRDEAGALAEGMARTGGLITSAAAIMVAVFAAFAMGDLLLVRILGFALAVAVLLDATLIRIAIGPALLSLAGRWNWWPALLAVLAISGTGCSVRGLAAGRLADAVAEGDASYRRDDDPELVREASPFALKTIESLLEARPRHRRLLLAAARGFTQYAFAFVRQEADFAAEGDPARARALRQRARRLYLRARDYGFRGLEADLPGFREGLRRGRDASLAKARRPQVALLYWTALAWAEAMGLAQDDAELTADQDLVESMMRRALALDEGFEAGALHDFLIAWEGRRSAAGGSLAKAEGHLERALVLSRGRRAAPLVIYAETVAVARQDRAEFERRLGQALDIDPDRTGEGRLDNLLFQKRARWLLARSDEVFIQ